MPGEQRRLHLQACALDATFRILVMLTSFSVSRSFALRLSAGGRSANKTQILRAVSAARGAVPGSNCLSEALTSWVLLSRGGHDPRLRLGVSSGGKFAAHAWVECDGAVFFGVDADHDYHQLEGPDMMRWAR